MTFGKPITRKIYFRSGRYAAWTGWVAMALGLSAPVQAEDATLVDRIEVVVGDRLVTHSDIELERELLARGGGIMAELYAGMSVHQALVDATILRTLASNLAMYQPQSEQVLERLEDIKETWVEPAAYADFLVTYGLTESRLEGILYSRLVVERYVERNAPRVEGPPAVVRAAYQEWMEERRSRLTIRLVSPSVESSSSE